MVASSSSRIALDADTLTYHVGKIRAAHDGIPAGSQVQAGLQGHDGEEAEKVFHTWLSSSATRLANATDGLRRNLAQNAGALQQAAEQLLQRNEISADQAQAFIAALKAAPAATGGTTTPGATPAPTPDSSLTAQNIQAAAGAL